MKINTARENARTCYYGVRRRLSHWKNALSDPKPKLLVLTYHRVLPEVKYNPLNTIISKDTFIRQIDSLADRFPVVTLEDALDPGRAETKRDKTLIALTFDDCYIDNYEIVFPVLKKRGIRAAFFAGTDYIGMKRPLWEWEIFVRLSLSEDIKVVEGSGNRFRREAGESQSSFAFRVLEGLKSANAGSIDSVTDYLRTKSKSVSHDFAGDICVDWPHLSEMSREGMVIGSHALSHRPLARMPLEEAIKEIRTSKSVIEEKTKKTCKHFAFPFGSRKDYSNTLIEAVRQAGYETCLLNIHGYNHIEPAPFILKRIVMEEATNMNHLLG
jgi:peptidoglycan/xylan/chitin deacetylase (PgdA/CDA1 family)